MNAKEKLELLKRKLNKLEEKINQINIHKFVLFNASNEINKRKNIKLHNIFYNVDLEEEISYLNDWIDFYKEKLTSHRANIDALEKEILQQELTKQKNIEEEVRKQIKELFGEKTKPKTIENIFKQATKLDKNKIIKYSVPILLSLLIISILFVSKPEISGYVVLSKEKIYNESLNLKINESSNYTWTLDKPLQIKSLKATGSVIGNGTVKIYIEKDGRRYLMYKNK